MTKKKSYVFLAFLSLVVCVPISFPQQLFEPGKINTKLNEYGLTFIDKDWICFTRSAGGRKRTLMFSKKTKAGWGQPYTAPFSGIFDDEYASFDPVSSRLIFSSKRPRPGSSVPQRSNDLWYVELSEGNWGEPVHLGGNFSTKGIDSGGSIVKNWVYFHSDRGGRGLNAVDIYALKLNEPSASPKKLRLNSEKVDGEAFIFNRGMAMLFMSGRPGTMGKSDIFLSVKSEGAWQKPISIDTSGRINTDNWEYAPVLSPDNSKLFFTRLVSGQSEIFWIETSNVPILKELINSSKGS